MPSLLSKMTFMVKVVERARSSPMISFGCACGGRWTPGVTYFVILWLSPTQTSPFRSTISQFPLPIRLTEVPSNRLTLPKVSEGTRVRNQICPHLSSTMSRVSPSSAPAFSSGTDRSAEASKEPMCDSNVFPSNRLTPS